MTKPVISLIIATLLLITSWIAAINFWEFMATGCCDYSLVRASVKMVFLGGFIGGGFLIWSNEKKQGKPGLW